MLIISLNGRFQALLVVYRYVRLDGLFFNYSARKSFVKHYFLSLKNTTYDVMKSSWKSFLAEGVWERLKCSTFTSTLHLHGVFFFLKFFLSSFFKCCVNNKCLIFLSMLAEYRFNFSFKIWSNTFFVKTIILFSSQKYFWKFLSRN